MMQECDKEEMALCVPGASVCSVDDFKSQVLQKNTKPVLSQKYKVSKVPKPQSRPMSPAPMLTRFFPHFVVPPQVMSVRKLAVHHSRREN